MKNKRIEIIKPEYVFLKLTPNFSIRNNETHLIARTVSNMYKNFWASLIQDKKVVRLLKKHEVTFPTKVTWNRQGKIGYYIYMEKEKIEFYFIIPTMVYNVIKERISGVWPTITREVVKELPSFSDDAYKLQMIYEKEDGLSLNTNRSDNKLLNATLNVVELLEEKDKVGIFYNFIPVSQNGFKFSYQSTIDKVKNNQPTERQKLSSKYLFKMTIGLIDSLINLVSESFAGKSVKKEENIIEAIIDRLNGGKQLSESTIKKINGQIIESQIVVMSESQNREWLKERSYATAVAQSFDVVSGDNRLIPKKFNGKFDFMKKRFSGIQVNKIWDEEAQSFISLPGRELLERFPFIGKIETQETPLDEDLQTGVFCIGETTFRGKTQKAYLTEDEEYRKLVLVLIGPTRSGKTNFISHLCMDGIENGECVFMLDFIDTCQASGSVRKNFPKEKTLVIKFDDPMKIEGLGYNESNQEGLDENPFMHYDRLKQQTTNTIALVNSINDSSSNDSNLSPRMGRYLECACLIVYASFGGIKDVFEVLTNHVTRNNFINNVPKKLIPYLDSYIEELRELDHYVKGELEGTKTTLVIGILDRLSMLNRNTYMELMLKKGTENNVNLVEEFQKNQLIVVEIPESMFTTQEEKDVMVTYWSTKIWYALQLRSVKYKGNLKKVNLIIDEIYQVPSSEIFWTKKISQGAKFGFKPIISCHYIKQLKHIRDELRSVNPSYMLIAGCDKDNFKELKDELRPFDAEDLQNLPRYSSMNYIKTKQGYARFITKLPGDVAERTPKKDDSNIINMV